jgi:hypothetical protein
MTRLFTFNCLKAPPRAALFLVAVLAGHFLSCQSFAQSSKETQLKAVLLFRLTQFVQWPESRFETPDSPIVIGLLGKDPFGESLRIAVRGETAQNRPITILPLERTEQAKSCHIVFISQSEAARVRQITTALAGNPILTVSDVENFVRVGGGMVRFYTEQNKVKLRINNETAKAAGLVLDSRLLRMAEIVENR